MFAIEAASVQIQNGLNSVQLIHFIFPKMIVYSPHFDVLIKINKVSWYRERAFNL